MNDYEKYAKLLESVTTIDRKPVGVKILQTKKKFRKHPFPEKETHMVYCTLVRDGGNGISRKIAGDNFACFGSAMALGIIPPREGDISGSTRHDYGGFKSLALSRSFSQGSVYCLNVNYGVAVGPLEAFTEDPDIVIVIANTLDSMRIVNGYRYAYGLAEGFNTMGSAGICKEVTSIPFERNKINISLLCSGTRNLCKWETHELAIGMPYHYFNETVLGVMKTINPFEKNGPRKRLIAEQLEKNGFSDLYEVDLEEYYGQILYNDLKPEELEGFYARYANED